ncbi:MAG TPA: hypothetical protein VHA74_03740 [Candidatus Dojkabacteria bacterium]|nr:hypothetical protein [Candidatus Dojkabacteria bacterium]
MDKNRTKTIITAILVVTLLLGVAAIVTAYYYLQVKDVTPQNTNAAQACGCYFVNTTDTLKSCSDADPKQAFEYRTGTVQTNGSCSASCDLRTAATLVNTSTTVGGSTTNGSVISCKANNSASAFGCIDLSVENPDGNRYANSITPTTPITIKAKFVIPSSVYVQGQDFYKDFSFLINGNKVSVDTKDIVTTGTDQDKSFTVSTKMTGYNGADTLTIQAFGNTVTNTQLTSEACLRQLAIAQPKVAACTKLNYTVALDTTTSKPKVSNLSLQLGGLTTEPKSLSVTFTAGTGKTKLTTGDITSYYSNGTVSLDNAYLYKSSNFTSNNNFSVLDSETSKVDVAAQVTVDGKAIDSQACALSQEVPTKTPTDTDPTVSCVCTNGKNLGTMTQSACTTAKQTQCATTPSDTPTATNSNFAVTNTASLACVERTSPDNQVTYTIRIKNNASDTQNVTSVLDKLPLGFTYVTDSTVINGASATDTSTVTVSTTGSTQSLTFQVTGGWSVTSGSTMTITFKALASSSALTGANLNEVVVTPVNTPTDSTTLRSQASVEVAQSCTAPDTGLFDSTLAKIILSLVIIVIGFIMYYSELGEEVSMHIMNSSVFEGLRLQYLRITKPNRYFEEKTVKKLSNRKKN